MSAGTSAERIATTHNGKDAEEAKRGTGADGQSVPQERLVQMLPDLRVFLDVDDMLEGRGMEYVDRSSHFLAFITLGYTESPNCMRELLRAVLMQKKVTMIAKLLLREKDATGQPLPGHYKPLVSGPLRPQPFFLFDTL